MRKQSLLFLLVFCWMLTALDCSGCEKSPVDSGTGSAGETSSLAESSDKEGWRVSVNPDGIELKMRVEKKGEESFRIYYVLTNNGETPIYRVVPGGDYYVLITPYDRVGVEKGYVPDTDNPDSMELVIWFGVDPISWLAMRYLQAQYWATYEELGIGKLIDGHVDIQFPVKRTSWAGQVEKPGENEIYEMAKSESGVPCMVAFVYTKEKVDVPCQIPYDRHIESKRFTLKID